MKIIFLDIDDLMYVKDYNSFSIVELNLLRKRLKIKFSEELIDSLKDKSISNFLNFTPQAVEYLKKLCVEEVMIVISSAWRCSHSLAQLKALFSIYDLDEKIIGLTPDININNRGEEIESWLRENIAEIDAFVILDDLDIGISNIFLNHFVHCPNGFHFESHFEKTKQILNTSLRGENSNSSKFLESAQKSIIASQPVLIRSYDFVEYKLVNECNQNQFIQKIAEIAKFNNKNACLFTFDNLASQTILELLTYLQNEKIAIHSIHFLDCKKDLGNVLKDWISNFPYPLILKLTLQRVGFNNIFLEAVISNKNIKLELHYLEFVFWEIKHNLIATLEKESRINWSLYDPGIETPICSTFTFSKKGPQFFKEVFAANSEDIPNELNNQITT